MKKSAIALAVAAAMSLSAVAQADTTLYGSIRLSANNVDTDGDDVWDMQSNASRFGVKGSEDLGGGLSAIYQYEFSVVADNSTSIGNAGHRLSYVGLKGGFGTVTAGRQWGALYNAIYFADIFNGGTSANALYDVALGGSTGSGRVSDSIQYVSPSMGGFSLAALIAFDAAGANNAASDPSSDGLDMYQVAATYSNGGINVGLGYQETDGGDVGDDQEVWGAGASYTGSVVGIHGAYYDRDEYGDGFDVVGEYYFGDNTVRLGYGDIGRDNGEDTDYWVAGFQHRMSKRTRVWVEYGDGDVLYNADEDDSLLSIGIRHDF